MDDRKIRSLLTVLETGSISSAAEKLNGTQSGITQTMNALEAELGFKVLIRTNRGVTLTEAGERILPFLRQLDEDFMTLERESREIAAGKGMIIRIGTYSSIANSWLPDVLAAYREENPDADFEILVSSDKLPRWLQKGKADLLLVDEELGQGFRWYPIMQDEYKAAVPASSVIAQKKVITEDELLQYPMIVSMMTSYRRYRNLQEGYGRRVIRVSTDDDTTIIRMVQKGLGVSIIAGLSGAMVPDNVRVIPLEPPVFRTIGAALPEQPVKAVKKFAEYLVQSDRAKQFYGILNRNNQKRE
ncbi:MAG: LysR family transcriptional regulator [Clostridium sp.]|nr:LysR family transcriptional regulator [Clostridium sp.]